MKQIKVYICHEEDGTYSCYMDNCPGLGYGLKGEGGTVQEALADWQAHYEDMRRYFEREAQVRGG